MPRHRTAGRVDRHPVAAVVAIRSYPQREGESLRMARPETAPSVRAMSRSVSTSMAPPALATVPFHSILCGVDGSRVAAEAARQAAILATAGARLVLLGVGSDTGDGVAARATIAPQRMAAALETARLEAEDLGVLATVDHVESRQETATLLKRAADHELLVLGASTGSREMGILAGSTASAAVHAAPVPVLLARRPAADVAFPTSILAAIDGTPASAGVAHVAAALARAHDARVSVVAPAIPLAPGHEVIAEAIATIAEATGAEPMVLDEHSSAHRSITGAAARTDAALVVMGSRGLQGAHALTSVSERVAHEAPCSVLILRQTRQLGVDDAA
jgi:nucleotide-binding universal stress UspA family protein